MRTNFHELPANLPVPKDDGACDHLVGMRLPDITLASTGKRDVSLRDLSQEKLVLFFYPRTGRPDEGTPEGWDEIPGARGCTPQSCAYRDHYKEFQALGIQVYGVSTQTVDFQQELVQRLSLPYPILSDADFKLTEALRLPTFTYKNMRLLKRMALVVDTGEIEKVFYPVFPPNKNAETVLSYLSTP